MNAVRLRRKVVAVIVIALSGSGVLVATSAAPAAAVEGCAGKAYVNNNADGTVSVITTATGAVSPPITVPSRPVGVAITPDGKHAYVANIIAGTVSVITTATAAVSPPITVGNGPDGRRSPLTASTPT